jgi:hypothetical protein
MASDCERFEIEIGMRPHGALDAREERALDEHLARCGACRRFALDGGDVTTALSERAAADLERVDFTAMHAGVERWRRNCRLKLWLAPLFLLQVPLIFLAGTGHLPPRELLLLGPPLTVAIYVGYVWLIGRPFREVLAVARHADDLVTGYARELERRRTRARIFGWINLGLAFASLVSAFGVFGDGGTRLMIYGLGCALVFGGWSAFDFAIVLPRVRRALADVRR